MSNWFYYFFITQTCHFSLFLDQRRQIPIRTNLTANWTAWLRSQFCTWNGNISQQSETDVKSFSCSYDDSRGNNKRKHDETSTWSVPCRPRGARLFRPAALALPSNVASTTCFPNEIDSATETDKGPCASKLKKLEMTKIECWWHWFS